MSVFLTIRCHGGQCCGIKHIEGFNSMVQQPAITTTYRRMGRAMQSKNAGKEFFSGNAPIESTEDRLKRFLDYIKEEQPKGIVEVVLVNWQIALYKKILLNLGFKEVTPRGGVQNSNSGNNLYVFHLYNK